MNNIVKVVSISSLFLLAAVRPALACEYNLCATTSYGATLAEPVISNLEIHAFSFAVTAEDVIIIRVNSIIGTFIPRLELLGPGGNTVATAGSGAPAAHISNLRLGQGGEYQLLVRDLNGNGKGEYAMTIQCANNPGAARAILPGQVLRDTLDLPSEMHAFTFDGLVGDEVNILMIGTTGDIDPQLTLYDPMGEQISTASGNVDASISGVQLMHGGRHTIMAADVGGDEPGIFILDFDMTPTDADDDNSATPDQYALNQNYPNPFNPQTTISFNLPRRAQVAVSIYNVAGERVRLLADREFTAGPQQLVWDGRDDAGAEVTSGIYFYRLTAGDFVQSRKMVLMK